MWIKTISTPTYSVVIFPKLTQDEVQEVLANSYLRVELKGSRKFRLSVFRYILKLQHEKINVKFNLRQLFSDQE